MGKILTRTESAQTKLPGVVMTADRIANTTLTKSARLKGNGYRHDMFSDEQKTLTQGSKQEVNTLIKTSDKTSSVEEIENKDSAECGLTRTLEEDSLPLESFPCSGKDFDDWGNHSVQLYQTDEEEEIPYWLNYEHMDSKAYDTKANTCYSNADCIISLQHKTDISDQHTTRFKSLHVHGQHEINSQSSTKTDERIQSLKALLAEQEKAISRLKSESRARLSESKEVHSLLKEDQTGCENGRDMPIDQNHHTLKTEKYFCKELKALTSTNRKRICSDTGLSNTKRFRYNFRKDVPQQGRSYFERKTGEGNALLKEKFMFECVNPDIKKETFTQDEFLSFLGLIKNRESEEMHI